IAPTSPGDGLNVNLTGATVSRLTMSAPDSGQLTFGNRQPVSFTGVESFLTPPCADPGFETPVQTGGAWAYTYNPTGSPSPFHWMSGVTANATNFTGLNPSAPQGQQVAFLQGGSSVLSQNVLFFSTGTYVVSFQAAQRYNNKQTFRVLVDGNVVGT